MNQDQDSVNERPEIRDIRSHVYIYIYMCIYIYRERERQTDSKLSFITSNTGFKDRDGPPY